MFYISLATFQNNYNFAKGYNPNFMKDRDQMDLSGLIPYGGDVNYDDYLQISNLLKLQKPLSEPLARDEMLFIIIHQVYELWFKLILFELEKVVNLMEENRIREAEHLLARCGKIFELLIKQIHILKTMRPIDFLSFRNKLNPASGFQSAQFRELEYLLGLKDERYLPFFKEKNELYQRLLKRLNQKDIRTAYYELLQKRGWNIPIDFSVEHLKNNENARNKLLQTLKEIYSNPTKYPDEYNISERLMDIDEGVRLWRSAHAQVVERVIGYKKGTGGSKGVDYLRSTINKKVFPYLWEVRTLL